MSTVKVIEDKQGEERQATPTLALEGSVKYENDPVRLHVTPYFVFKT